MLLGYLYLKHSTLNFPPMSLIMKKRFDEKDLCIEVLSITGGPMYPVKYISRRCAGTAMRIVAQNKEMDQRYLAERIRLEQAAEKTKHIAR